jgi:hypothetical protein
LTRFGHQAPLFVATHSTDDLLCFVLVHDLWRWVGVSRTTKENNMTAKWQREKADLDRRLALKLTLVGASALLASKGGSALAADGGDKGAMRERPDRLLYILQGAKVRFHYPGGKTEDAVWKTGDVVYQKADNRQVENIDMRDLEYISVHLK